MNVSSAVPAARRARSAAVVAAAGVVAALLGCWWALDAPRRGIPVGFLGLVVIHAAVRHRQDLMVLARLGERHVDVVADPVAVLRRRGSSDGLAELCDLAGQEVGVVSTATGWRILTRHDVADAVLAAVDGRFTGDWERYLRAAPVVRADLPVDRLRRLPERSEYWLVAGRVGAPRVITAAALHRAARDDRTPPTTPPARDRPPGPVVGTRPPVRTHTATGGRPSARSLHRATGGRR